MYQWCKFNLTKKGYIFLFRKKSHVYLKKVEAERMNKTMNEKQLTNKELSATFAEMVINRKYLVVKTKDLENIRLFRMTGDYHIEGYGEEPLVFEESEMFLTFLEKKIAPAFDELIAYDSIQQYLESQDINRYQQEIKVIKSEREENIFIDSVFMFEGKPYYFERLYEKRGEHQTCVYELVNGKHVYNEQLSDDELFVKVLDEKLEEYHR